MIRPLTILLAEDSPEDRELTARSLRGVGYFVVEFENGDQVKDYLLTSPVLPDLVITDWRMPKVSGIELCRLMKSSETLRHVPVILLTGYSREDIEGIHGAVAVRADQIVEKKVHPEAMLLAVRTLLERGRV